MKKTGIKSVKKTHLRLASLVAAAVVVGGGSFAFASGEVPGVSGSFFAAVFSALSGKPAIIISRSSASLSGTVPTGSTQSLAVFDVYSKNVTYWATLKSFIINFNVSGPAAQALDISNIFATYKYCIPAGVKYGYGYMGGGCGGFPITVSSVSRVGNQYSITAYSSAPIYPQATGQITVGGTLTKKVGGLAGTTQVRAQIVSATGGGDQCRAYTYSKITRSYGYSSCVPLQANVTSAAGNTLTVKRSYGYGYCWL